MAQISLGGRMTTLHVVAASRADCSAARAMPAIKQAQTRRDARTLQVYCADSGRCRVW